jgi:hypothetical protein
VTALQKRAGGWGYRRIATHLGMRHLGQTVRNWLRALASAAEALRAHFTRWAYGLACGADRAEGKPGG